MSKQIITPNKHVDIKIQYSKNTPTLKISELFSRTIQGEGVYAGHPATFLRLSGCTLNCKWCDTAEVWKQGIDISFDYLFQLFEENKIIEDFKNGHHLVITGGSPLKQGQALADFLNTFWKRYNFKPFIEIENEAVLPVSKVAFLNMNLISLVDCWNNSPKLTNSGKRVVKPEVLKQLSSFENSWFKFVVSDEEDVQEIIKHFKPYIRQEQIILMPLAASQKELRKRQENIAELAVKYNMRYSSREHVQIWDLSTGV